MLNRDPGRLCETGELRLKPSYVAEDYIGRCEKVAIWKCCRCSGLIFFHLFIYSLIHISIHFFIHLLGSYPRKCCIMPGQYAFLILILDLRGTREAKEAPLLGPESLPLSDEYYYVMVGFTKWERKGPGLRLCCHSHTNNCTYYSDYYI